MARNPIAPGNHDKAWNDPPQLSFNASSQSSSSNRLKMMKKRIPVPMNSTGSTSITPLVPSQKLNNPPPMMQLSTKDVCLEDKVSEINVTDDVSPFSEEMLAKSFENLINKIFYESQDIKISSKEDVKKRIGLLEEMWMKNQLHSEVRKQMTQLIIALNKDDYDTAWSIHQSLIVDYTTDCSTWMSGIKTLIVEGRNLVAEQNADSVDTCTKESEHRLPLFLNPGAETQ